MSVVLAVCDCLAEPILVGSWRGGVCIYGGNSRFGRRSSSNSPSFGGGISGSGGHAVMLCGVFQGSVCVSEEGAVCDSEGDDA